MHRAISLLAAGLQVQAAVITITQAVPTASILPQDAPQTTASWSLYRDALDKYVDARKVLEAAESNYFNVQDIYASAFAEYQGIVSKIEAHEKSLGLFSHHDLKARQAQPACPPPTTITIIQAPPLVTIVAGDPSSIASSFAYASGVDSLVYQNSIQDRPTGNAPETTSIFFTHTASGPAIIGTDNPADNTILYQVVGTTQGPVATTVVGFPPADRPTPTPPPPPPNRPQQGNSTESTSHHYNGTVTITTYLSTVTIRASQITASPNASSTQLEHKLEKRQTCSMIFAKINGQWASWCNNWDGTKVLSYTSFDATTVLPSVIGAPAVPTSVYNPATAQTATSTKSNAEMTTSSEIVVFPVTTITEIHSGPTPTTSACGEQDEIEITFDNLPVYSNKDENSTIVPPIFNPYDHFFWTAGYGYGPQPPVPFAPHDGTRLGMYRPEASFPPDTTIEGRDQPGSFGAGKRAGNNIYWFLARYLYVGCNTTAPCTIASTGYRWYHPDDNSTDGYEQVAFVQHDEVASICEEPPCNMTRIEFEISKFSGLSTLNLQAYAGNATVGFFMDSFEGWWTNTTCEAGLERQSSRKRL